MVNRCKVEMKRRELYNVVESPKEGDGRIVREKKKRNKIRLKKAFRTFFLPFREQYLTCIRPSIFTEAKFFNPSSTNIYCGLCFGPRPDQRKSGQENRATTIGAVCGKN